MTSGISQALTGAPPAGALRNVVFLTDGYIGNEVDVLTLVDRLLGDARLHAFGIGTGVNRYLLGELGRVGRGLTRYVDPTAADREAAMAEALDLADKLETPVLTDIEIDWGGMEVADVVPAAVPDLYEGDSIRITGRYRVPVSGEVTISGRAAGRRARLNRWVELTDGADHPGVRRIWARSRVAERMHAFITPQHLRPGRETDADLQAGITRLGLDYDLVTRWTAFVAVSEKRYNDVDTAQDADVALPKVAGVTNAAYPAFRGSGAPEPAVWLGLLVGLAVSAWSLRRKAA